MPRISHLYFGAAAIFLLFGIAMGMHMSITHNHNVIPAHAHVNLLGWVTCALFGTYFALNQAGSSTRLAWVQFGVYLVGLVLMLPSLYFLILGNAAMEPLVAIGSILTSLGVVLFAVVVLAGARRAPATVLKRSPGL